MNLKVTIKTAVLVVLSFLLSSKRFKPITTEYNVQTSNLVSAILNVLSGTKNDIRDKKRYQGQKTISGTENDTRDRKRYQGDISFLCPPVINLIKTQVCDKWCYPWSSNIGKRRLAGIYRVYKKTRNHLIF